LSKSCQKIVKKLSKSYQKVIKSCQKNVKVVKKRSKFKRSGEDDDEEEYDWWLLDQVATLSHLVKIFDLNFPHFYLRPDSEAVAEGKGRHI
jgi:hypothetical protein